MLDAAPEWATEVEPGKQVMETGSTGSVDIKTAKDIYKRSLEKSDRARGQRGRKSQTGF